MKGLLATLLKWGPLGVLVISIVDSAGIPVVGGVDGLVVLFAVRNPAEAYSVAAIAVLGSIIGSLILFAIARRGGEAYFERHAQSARGVRMKRWFQEYGLLTVLIPAMIPIPLPLKLFIIAAGAFQVNPFVFTVVITVARIPRYFFLAWLGRRLGTRTLPYLEHHVLELLVLSAALFGILYLLIKVIDRRRKLRAVVSGQE